MQPYFSYNHYLYLFPFLVYQADSKKITRILEGL